MSRDDPPHLLDWPVPEYDDDDLAGYGWMREFDAETRKSSPGENTSNLTKTVDKNRNALVIEFPTDAGGNAHATLMGICFLFAIFTATLVVTVSAVSTSVIANPVWFFPSVVLLAGAGLLLKMGADKEHMVHSFIEIDKDFFLYSNRSLFVRYLYMPNLKIEMRRVCSSGVDERGWLFVRFDGDKVLRRPSTKERRGDFALKQLLERNVNEPRRKAMLAEREDSHEQDRLRLGQLLRGISKNRSR